MLSRNDRSAMMKFVEGTREDKKRDKKTGHKEGRAADVKADTAPAKKMLVRGNRDQLPPKGWPK